MKNLGYNVAETLKSLGSYLNSAKIFIEYCHDIDEAVLTLTNGCEWSEAIRIVN